MGRQLIRLLLIALATVAAVAAIATIARVIWMMRDWSPPVDASGPKWDLEVSVIEASTCPVFCRCCDDEASAEQATANGAGVHPRLRRFNSAYRVNRGTYDETSLEGTEFWVAGDLGSGHGDAESSWAVLTFDRTTTGPQRKAIRGLFDHLVPRKWGSFSTAEGDIEWADLSNQRRIASRATDYARASLDGGRTAELALERPTNVEDAELDVVLQNLRYWRANSSNGFVLMPAQLQAWRGGDRTFEYRGSDGFTLTFHMRTPGKWW